MTTKHFHPAKKISTFYPPQRTLMGPGPSDTHPRVLSAMSRPTLGHMDPVFTDMMEELKSMLRYSFQTDNPLTFPVSGPGSVGMEMCFVNMVNPGDKVIVCRNGVFGSRMIENVQRCGGTAVVVEDKWGEPVDPQKVEDALKKNPDAKIVAFVHAETSTGVLSDAKTLCEIAHRHNCLTIVDAVTSLGGSPLKVDEWKIDAIYSGSQKCLSCPPGLSPVSFSERVVEMVKGIAMKPLAVYRGFNQCSHGLRSVFHIAKRRRSHRRIGQIHFESCGSFKAMCRPVNPFHATNKKRRLEVFQISL